MKIRRDVKIGVFSASVILLFFLGINFIKGKDMFRKHRKFYARYEHVAGLSSAASVSVNGLDIGKVSDVHFAGDASNNVIVEMSIYNNIQIPENSVARIFTPDILGTRSIEIVIGDSPIMAENGDTLISEMQATLSEEVSQQVAPLKRKAEGLMGSIDTMITVVRSVLNLETRENLNASFQHIRQTIFALEHTTYNLDTLVYGQRTRLERIFYNVESISENLRQNNDKITNIIDNFSAISDTVARANLSKTLLDLQYSVTSVSMAMEKINNSEGSMGLLLNDKKLYNDLESAGKELNSLVTDIKLNPHRYLNFSVFPPGGKRMKYKEPEGK
ncbi:MAG TPA: MlaD family protein [Bacteroidales bacterium]|nr:MlaD family protein [Bacteroidales bacterium]HPT01561.1 MlaD family protein [Bacteroidales bacterium]